MKTYFRKAIYNILTFFIAREKLIFLLANKEEHALLGFKQSGYLYDIGWVNSMVTDAIVDKTNAPLPWVTYPFIHFIDHKLHNQLEIFEYGSGNSTLYYSKKVAGVTSVENDNFWYNKIKNTMPPNVSLFYCELVTDGDYCRYVQQTQKSYDLIIVDGRDRVNCCIQSIKSLKPGGVLVLDDTERDDYVAAVNFLTDNGFKRLDFWGLAPTVNYLKCTTIFYKSNNCLKI